MRSSRILGICFSLILASNACYAAPEKVKVVTQALNTKDGLELKTLLGEAAAKASLNLIVDHNLKAGFSSMKVDAAVEATAGFAEIEVKTVKAINIVVADLAQKLKDGKIKLILDANEMKPAEYGAKEGDSEAMKASRWVNNASNSTKGNEAEIKIVAKIIEEAIKKTKLTDSAHLATLNKVLANKKTADYRAIVMSSPLPSSPAGARLLNVALQDISKKKIGDPGMAAADLPGYLLGALVRCHGFVDGNGRTARVAYAVAMLQGGLPFKAVTSKGEKALHGLDEQ